MELEMECEDHYPISRHCRSMKQNIDESLVESVTDVLQSQERLVFNLRDASDHEDVAEECSKALDLSRSMKAKLEGNEINLPGPALDQEALQKLRTLMLMHLPRTLTPEVKAKFNTCIKDAFKGTMCRVIYARLCWCPWYVSTQPELGQQAKHNTIFIVFTNPDHYTFTAISQHSREQTEIIDLEWMYAVEVSHFVRHLAKSKSRMVESVFADEIPTFIKDDTWSSLMEHLSKEMLIGQPPFLEMCRGQAVGGVAKKSKVSGQMKLRPEVTLYQFCESFRLLQYATDSLTKRAINTSELDLENLGETGKAAQQLLSRIYQHEGDGRTKEDLFDLLMKMKTEVDDLMKNSKRLRYPDLPEQLGKWVKQVRVGDRNPVANTGLTSEQREGLVELMQKVGGPVSHMEPENIVMIIRAGSYLYNLATPESDVDYLVVYARPTIECLSKVSAPKECTENRGPSLQIEYGAYEIRLFAEMLLKGSVVTSEAVFIGDAEFVTPAWKALCSRSQLFVTEHVILQYLGLIGNNMHNIESGKYKNEPKEKKLFYQIFHKLWTLEFLLEGKVPAVKTSGEIHDFIMSVRRGPLEGDLSRDNLHARARSQLQSLKKRLGERKRRLPEHADLAFLTDWLLTVRGLYH